MAVIINLINRTQFNAFVTDDAAQPSAATAVLAARPGQTRALDIGPSANVRRYHLVVGDARQPLATTPSRPRLLTMDVNSQNADLDVTRPDITGLKQLPFEAFYAYDTTTGDYTLTIVLPNAPGVAPGATVPPTSPLPSAFPYHVLRTIIAEALIQKRQDEVRRQAESAAAGVIVSSTARAAASTRRSRSVVLPG